MNIYMYVPIKNTVLNKEYLHKVKGSSINWNRINTKANLIVEDRLAEELANIKLETYIRKYRKNNKSKVINNK